MAPEKFRTISKRESDHLKSTLLSRNWFLTYLENVGTEAISNSADSHKKVTMPMPINITLADCKKLAKNIAAKKPPQKCNVSGNQ